MKPLVFDIETSISKTKIHGVSSKNQDTDFYTVIRGFRPDKIEIEHKKEGWKRRVGDGFLYNVDIVVGHNLSFDLGYIWNCDAWQNYLSDQNNTIWDTSEAQYILSGQRHKYSSLAELQEIYLNEKIKEDRISKLFKKGVGADQILSARTRCKRVFALYESYCEGDGSSTLRIFAAQYRLAKEKGMLKLIQSRMKGLLAILLMQNTGINVNVIKCEQTLRDFKIKALDYLSEASQLIEHLWDERLGPFKINSPKHKSAILFGGTFTVKKKVENGKFKNGNIKYTTIDEEIEIMGFDLPKEFTRNSKIEGRSSTDDKVIHTIYKKSDNKIAVKYCELQKLAMKYNKMCSTYLEPFLKFSIDGLLYPNYNTVGTETSRLSSSKPNMQNVPASGEMLLPIQGQLIAPEGWVCVDIDYSSLEPWVTALVTEDVNLTNDLLSGVCLHCRAVSWIPRLSAGKTYEEIYQLAMIEKRPEWVLARKKAKGINFKRAYGGGAKSLAEAEELAVEDVQAVFDSQDIEYSEVKAFNDRLYSALDDNQQLSREINFSRSDRRSRKFAHGIELLPIFDYVGNKTYREGEYRHFGTYKSPLGHLFTFEEIGRLDKWGNLRRGYSTTETKNYQIQGCLNGATKIFTVDGMFEIKDLVNQNVVVWTKGGYSKAVCLPSGKKKELILTMMDGNSVKCSPTHKFLCVQPSTLAEYWLTAEQIFEKIKTTRVAILNGEGVEFSSEGILLTSRRIVGNGYKKTSFNSLKDKLVRGILLGRLASDGSITKDKSVSWLFAEHEIEVEEYLKPYITTLGQATIGETTNHTQYVRRYTVNRTQLALEVQDEIKTKIPTICWKDKILLKGYLSGMFDGDGTVNNDGQVVLVFGKQVHKIEWAKEIQLALRLFGIRSRVRHYKDDRTVVQVMKADGGLFRDRIGFINSKKQGKLLDAGTKRNRHNITYVRSVEDTGKFVEMYDICNSENEIFCANGLVTHNTAGDIVQLAAAECMYYVLRNSKELRMVRQIHDALSFYVKKGAENVHIPVLCGIMNNIKHLTSKYLNYTAKFNFQTEAKVGENFAEMQVYKLGD